MGHADGETTGRTQQMSSRAGLGKVDLTPSAADDGAESPDLSRPPPAFICKVTITSVTD